MFIPKKIALPALAFLIAFPVLLSNGAFAHGDGPSACENRYDSEITSMTLDNGMQTFDPIADAGVAFDAQVADGYDVTFTLHAANASSANNTLPGDAWYRNSAFGFGSGNCVDGAGPDQDITVTVHVDAPYGGVPDGYQQNNVEWGSWPEIVQLAYDVTWRAAELEQERNETQSSPPEPPADEVQDEEPEEEENDEPDDNDPEGAVHSPFVFRDGQTSVSAQAGSEAQEPAIALDMLHINGTLLSYHALNETGVPQLHMLTGNWSMAMNDTAVTSFNANFTMARLDGTGEQEFSLGNLRAVNMGDMTLVNGTMSMNGTLDYNATGQMTRINATITVQNLTSIEIELEELEKPIHGVVDKVVRIENGQAWVMTRQFDMI